MHANNHHFALCFAWCFMAFEKLCLHRRLRTRLAVSFVSKWAFLRIDYSSTSCWSCELTFNSVFEGQVLSIVDCVLSYEISLHMNKEMHACSYILLAYTTPIRHNVVPVLSCQSRTSCPFANDPERFHMWRSFCVCLYRCASLSSCLFGQLEISRHFLLTLLG